MNCKLNLLGSQQLIAGQTGDFEVEITVGEGPACEIATDCSGRCTEKIKGKVKVNGDRLLLLPR